jgi:anti-sigma regulatory factor (Ser/Thr protein kinase)
MDTIEKDELYLDAKLENLPHLLDFIEKNIPCEHGRIKLQIKIAVEEIFSNISRYAYNPDVGGVGVSITADNAVATLKFEDCGVEYNPLNSAKPNIGLPVAERPIGGLGVLLVTSLMDSAQYARIGNKNVLTVQKQLTFDNPY